MPRAGRAIETNRPPGYWNHLPDLELLLTGRRHQLHELDDAGRGVGRVPVETLIDAAAVGRRLQGVGRQRVACVDGR